MSEKSGSEPVSIPYLHNSQAPEFYSTGPAGYWLHEGILTITFETAAPFHGGDNRPVERVVNGRLVMSVPAAQRLVLGLYDFLKGMGLDPADIIRTAGDPSKPQ
jgi:hypothetical protein